MWVFLTQSYVFLCNYLKLNWYKRRYYRKVAVKYQYFRTLPHKRVAKKHGVAVNVNFSLYLCGILAERC